DAGSSLHNQVMAGQLGATQHGSQVPDKNRVRRSWRQPATQEAARMVSASPRTRTRVLLQDRYARRLHALADAEADQELRFRRPLGHLINLLKQQISVKR